MSIGKALRFLRSLRFRLALSYVIFFSLLLIALGVVFRELLKTNQDAQVRAALDDEWGAVKGYLRIDKSGPWWFYDKDDPDETYTVERLRRFHFLADIEGNMLRNNNWPTGLMPRAEIKRIIASGQPSYTVKTINGQPTFIRSGIIFDENHKYRYFLAIGLSIAQNRRVLDDFTVQYFSIVPLVIAFSGLLGWFLAGRALRPVNSVAEAAQRITHSNLNLQIPIRGAGDELDRLIDAFNRMISRLSLSFEQIRQFSTDVSHELRTPLTVIRGQLEVALFTAKTTEQYRDAMVNALEGVEQLSNIVRALLMLSQAETGQTVLQKAETDLAEIVRDQVEQFQIPAEAQGVTLSADIAGPAPILGDRTQMERMITNLLSNAIKYTPEGGHVRVTVDSEADEVKLVVADTGVGISRDHLPHIFDRFYRVPSSDPEKGLGLGLSFVSWIVKAHDGMVDVESEVGAGTRFIVRLPAAESTPAQTEELVTH